MGGDVFEQSLRCIKWDGRLLVIGFAGGTIPQAPANRPLLKSCSIVGVSLGGYRQRAPTAVRDMHGTLLSWIAEGRIRPRVAARFPDAETTEALQARENRQTICRGSVTLA